MSHINVQPWRFIGDVLTAIRRKPHLYHAVRSRQSLFKRRAACIRLDIVSSVNISAIDVEVAAILVMACHAVTHRARVKIVSPHDVSNTEIKRHHYSVAGRRNDNVTWPSFSSSASSSGWRDKL